MIRVSRIVGESYDLDTGQELPKSMALTNGQQEILIPISDEDLQKIVLLLAQPLKEAKLTTPEANGYTESDRPDQEEPGEVHNTYWDPETGLESV